MAISVSFKKVYESNGLRLQLIKEIDNKEMVLVIESPDGKIPLDKGAALDLAQFFESSFRDMSKEKV
jgi:hypothetical protein